MRAVVFRPSAPRRLLARALGDLTRAVHWGRLSGVALREVPETALPGPGWVRLTVLKAGIARDDLRELAYATSPLLEPFGSWPAVPGREILGRVVEVGADVRGVEPGQRVVVDPFLSCVVRGFGHEPCPSCVRDLPATCARAGEEGAVHIDGRPLGPGTRLGAHADLPGGWSERMVAHQSQLLPVDDGLSDQAAVLVEPLASAFHAVLAAGVGTRHRTTGLPERPALVLGGGARALGTVRALRVLGFRGEIVARVGREAEVELALSLGATRAAFDEGELRDAMVETGGRAYMPLEGAEVWAGGGFSPVFEWTGTGDGLAEAIRHAAPRGRVVVAAAGGLPGGELALAAARAVRLVGVAGHGPRTGPVPDVSTFRLAHDLLLGDAALVGAMVTHVYPLHQFREALDAAAGRGREHPVKVLLDPGL